MDPTILAILCVTLGWALGLVSLPITEWFQHRSRRELIKQGIFAELLYARETMAAAVVSIEGQFGRLTKKKLKWFKDHVRDRELPEPFDLLKPVLDRLTQVSDEQFQEVVAKFTAAPGTSPQIKKYALPYTQSKLGDLDLFPEDFQRLVLDILSHLNILNQYVDESRFFRSVTYDSGISEVNNTNAQAEVLKCAQFASDQARTIVDFSTTLLKNHGGQDKC